MPTEVRLRRALGHERLGREHLPLTILAIGKMEVERHIYAFRAVHVDVLETAIVDFGNLGADLFLKIGILIKIAAAGFAELADVENAANLALGMGSDIRLPRTTLDATELVRRLGRIAFVRNKFATELQYAAVREHRRICRRFPNSQFCDVGIGRKRLSERKAARLVEPGIGNGSYIAALKPDVRMHRVETGGDASGLDLREHFLERLLAFRVLFAIIVVSAKRP